MYPPGMFGVSMSWIACMVAAAKVYSHPGYVFPRLEGDVPCGPESALGHEAAAMRAASRKSRGRRDFLLPHGIVWHCIWSHIPHLFVVGGAEGVA